ncbi:ATP-dependent RNA helicase DDX51-like [Paramacrobiotus metropolitanus]|uniref:ATP-dependent RNA helicase DDX51-like n=1 Tax=Paramacrobiotus metropolitanus TaxID=2943436 RepID=UPI0024456F1F|nr:ATP-dependent RNA helicase DDX51-like [Paramacrobiotus metropolitanus]
METMSMEHATTKNQRRKARKKLKRENHGAEELIPAEKSASNAPIPSDGTAVVPIKKKKRIRGRSRRANGNAKKPRLAAASEEDGEEPSDAAPKQAATVQSDFTIIGAQTPAKKAKLPPFLPAWYSSPVPIAAGLTSSLVPLEEISGLNPHFIDVLREQGMINFFPVQSAVIPEILRYQTFQRYYARRPRDLCVCAPTGSGKTLSYVLPILHDLISRHDHRIRALVLLPVKELAIQVADVFRTFAKGTRVKIALVCGKQSFEQEAKELFVQNDDTLSLPGGLSSEMSSAVTAVDVLIATPGRLVDHLYETKGLDMQALEYLIVDEADRMIEEFKNNWFRLLERAVFRNPEIRPALQYNCLADLETPSLPLQKLLFSATLSYDPQRFETLKLYRPQLFSVVSGYVGDDVLFRNDAELVGAYVTPEGLNELFVQCDPRLKPLIVLHLLHNLAWRRVLVFTNSLESTHRLYRLISLYKSPVKLNVQEVSSEVLQRKRQATLERFEKGNVDVIVASDAMARGIDLPNVDYVILYDVPLHAKTYIHRSGRTARAGRHGTTLTLLKPNEKKEFNGLVKALKKTFPKQLDVKADDMSALEAGYKKALKDLEDELEMKV